MAIDDFEITGPVNTPLPVEITSFTGRPLDQFNELSWVTSSEINNDRFEIERSVNGMDFIKIGEVKGRGTTSSVTNYVFIDKEVEDRNYYYRLRQIDYDGASEYLGVILVKREKKSSGTVDLIFPNPFSSKLYVLFKSALNEPVNVELFDLNGKIVYSEKILPEGIQLTLDLEDKNIRSGTYLLKLTSGKERNIIKVFKN